MSFDFIANFTEADLLVRDTGHAAGFLFQLNTSLGFL